MKVRPSPPFYLPHHPPTLLRLHIHSPGKQMHDEEATRPDGSSFSIALLEGNAGLGVERRRDASVAFEASRGEEVSLSVDIKCHPCQT